MTRKSDQIKQFRETARALECDEDANKFDKTLRKVARAKEPPAKPPKGKAKRTVR